MKTLSKYRISLIFKHGFFINNLMMLSITLFFFVMLNMTITREVTSNTMDYNETLVEEIQMIMDEKLYNATSLSNIVSSNKYIPKILTSDTATTQNLLIYDFIEDLNSYENMNLGLIDNIFVFLRDEEIIIGNGKNTLSSFFEKENYVMSFDEWKYLLYSDIHSEIITLKNGNIQVYTPLLNLQSGENIGLICIELNSKTLSESLANISQVTRGNVGVFSSNQLILHSGNSRPLKELDLDTLHTTGDQTTAQLIIKDQFVISKCSPFTDLTYVSVVPYKHLLSNVQHITLIFFISTAVFIFIAIILSHVFANKYRKPLVHIANLFDAPKEQLNIYNNIESNINHLKQHYEDSEYKLSTYGDLIRGNALKNLLLGFKVPSLEVKEIQDYFSETFIGAFYCLYMKSEGFYDTLESKAPSSIYAVEGMMEESLEDYECIETIIIDEDTLVMLLRKDPSISKATYKEQLEDTLKGFIHSNAADIHFGISSLVTDYSDLHKSYLESLAAYDYIKNFKDQQIMSYRSLSAVNDDYKRDVSFFAALSESIKNSRREKAIHMLRENFQTQVYSKENSMVYIQCLLNDYYQLFTSIALNLDIGNTSGFRKAVTRFEHKNLIEDKELALIDCFNCIHKSIELRMEGGIGANDPIILYCNNHYTENDFCLQSIADRFDMSVSSVSFYIKSRLNKGFTEYIRELKIQEAKKLLLNTNLSLNEICRKLNYSNSGVLIRNFKKVENMTPGQFKDMKLKAGNI